MADELQEVQITPRYIGPGAEIANARLDNNPTNPIYQPAAELTPDAQRDLNVLQTVLVEDSRIHAGEDVGLDLFYYQYQRYGAMTKEQQQAFVQLEDLANQRYTARQVGLPTRTTNQAIADAFQASGGPKEFGALNALEYETLRSYGAGNGPNAVSGTLMGWMDAVNSGASKVHDFGTWLRGFDNTAGKIGAGIVALNSGVTDVLARGVNGVLGIGVALTDTDTKLMMLRGLDYAVENPGRVAGDLWNDYLSSDFRDRGLTAVEALAGMGVGSAVTRMGRLAPELDSVSGRSGAYFFDEQVLPYIDRADATLGRAGEAQFFMPLEDSARVIDAASAYRYSGGAPSVARAYVSGSDVFGVEFPLNTLSPRLPTAADTTLEHFLEGGYTALKLPNGGGYLVNPTRELVVPGGGAMPSGAVLFRIGPDGTRIPIRSW